MALYVCKMESGPEAGRFHLVAIVGRLVELHDGWRFLPNTSAHKPSRRSWPTARAAIPTWARNLGLVQILNSDEMNKAPRAPAKKIVADWIEPGSREHLDTLSGFFGL